MKSRSILKVLPFLCALLFLSACGGGGDGDNNPTPPAGLSVTALAGTWFGVLEQALPSNTLPTISVVVNSAGQVTEMTIGGVPATGLPATISKVSGQIFSFAFNNGTEGGFIVDSAGGHLGFLDTTRNFGVLQKGAMSPLPTYLVSDLQGNWSGYGVTLDGAFDIAQTFNSNANVGSCSLAGCSFSGSNTLSGAFNVVMQIFNPNEGRYTGTFVNTTGGGSGIVHAFVSVDKAFVASYACDTVGGITFPQDCSFSAWSKQ